MYKRNILVAFVMLALLAGVGTARANCKVLGKITRLRAAQAGVGGATVDVAPLTDAQTYIIYYNFDNNRFLSILGSAQAANKTVSVTGDATSCGTTGIGRYGGNLFDVQIYRNN